VTDLTAGQLAGITAGALLPYVALVIIIFLS
jgi:hypothetical protein